jgi:hypothetical protein
MAPTIEASARSKPGWSIGSLDVRAASTARLPPAEAPATKTTAGPKPCLVQLIAVPSAEVETLTSQSCQREPAVGSTDPVWVSRRDSTHESRYVGNGAVAIDGSRPALRRPPAYRSVFD